MSVEVTLSLVYMESSNITLIFERKSYVLALMVILKSKVHVFIVCIVQVDAVRSALDSMGFKDVEIVVAETGWPYKGDNDEAGPSIENAKAYNGNLIKHLRSKVGTPLMPGKSVDTYIFALYDEDLKPGAGSEKAFGLYNTDQSMIYDAGLSKQQSTTPTPTSSPVVSPV